MWLGTFPLLQPLGLIQSLDSEAKAPETADFAHVRDNLKAVQVGGAWSQVGGAWVAGGRDVGLGAGGRGTAEAYYCFVVLYRGIAVIPVWVDIALNETGETTLPTILSQFKADDVYNVDGCGLFDQALPNHSLHLFKEKCH